MQVHRFRLLILALAAALVVAAAPSASAGTTFRLEIGPAVAGFAPGMKKKGTAFVVRGLACADAAKVRITGVAEGMLNGARRSVALQLTPLATPGAFAVLPAWPQTSDWVARLTGTCETATAGAVVAMRQDVFTRESSKVFDHAPSSAEVDAVLGALNPTGTR
jgi:hypothetical protein